MLAALVRYSPLLVVVAAWEASVRLGAIPSSYLPDFSSVVAALWQITVSGEMTGHLVASLYRLSVGFVLSVVVGVSIGITMGRVRSVELALRPLITLWYPVPVVALFPVLALVLKLGDQLQISVILLGSILPVIVSSFNAAKGVDHYLVWSALNMGTSTRKILWKIVLPAALPEILAGIRVALSLAIVLMVASEQLGASEGIGAFTLTAGQNGFYAGMFAGILTAAAMGFVADRLYLALVRRLLRSRVEL